MTIEGLVVGKTVDSWLETGIETYLKRLKHSGKRFRSAKEASE